MKKYIILIIVFSGIIIECIVYSQQWNQQNFLPQGNDLTAVFFVSAEKGWAVGDLGTILKTTDGGNNWEIVFIDFQKKINALYFLSEQTGFAVGNNGLILATENGGQNWYNLTFGNSVDHFYSIYFSTQNIGWIGGTSILKTTDAGKTWKKHDIGVFCEPYSIHFSSEKNGWMTGTAGEGNIVCTTDGGETWHPKFLDHRVYYSIRAISDSTVIAALNFSEILRTTDRGETWEKQTVKHQDNDIHFTSLFFTSDSVGWLVGQLSGNPDASGVILKTTNSGQDWLVVKDDIRWSLNSIYFADENTGWAAGDFGLILQTTDAGVTWHEQSDVLHSFLQTFREIDFVSRTTGWAAGGDVLIHTENGGLDWQGQNVETNHTISTLDFISENVGWLGCGNGTILKTENGGQTWEEQYSYNEDANFLTSIYFHSEDTGWALTNQYLLKTTNSGEIWERISVDTSDYLYLQSLFFASENTGWIIYGYNNIIYKTTNGGTDWQRIEIPVITELPPCEFTFASVFFVNKDTGWIVGAGGIIMKSVDGGETWEEQKNENDWTQDLYSVHFISGTTGWVVGRDGIILNTTDGGQTWNIQPSHTQMDLFDITFVSEGAGWISGQWGTILSMSGGIPASVERNQSDLLPVQYDLSQNYPNPFSQSTTIQYSLGKPAAVKLSVYNVQGQRIRILEDLFQPAGDYSVIWDGTDNNCNPVTSGIYFLNLETSDYCIQEKIILAR